MGGIADNVRSWVRRFIGTDQLIEVAHIIQHRTRQMALTLDDILTQGQTVLDGVKKNTDLDASIKAILDHDTELLVQLRQQLAQANVDPAKLQALGDLMGKIVDAQRAQAQAKIDAITANTDVPQSTP